ncbi:hypothetical protein G6O67_007110 [Ophiocordyceps sinensis]|uniref:Uncharacterized protein n=2 Tax=Ophiocordyceps sinensis TaxID=72228 RepID=A0A8H4LT57_9HYPO|nr:hypothetical protein OCS_03955 [Ophiocordyceps sinensis CO18]KAF4505129.1 hypothetical protein G6O67_007110 [Ophiocordyceps sinensis]
MPGNFSRRELDPWHHVPAAPPVTAGEMRDDSRPGAVSTLEIFASTTLPSCGLTRSFELDAAAGAKVPASAVPAPVPLAIGIFWASMN